MYCGSSTGTDPSHAEAARDLGAVLAVRGIEVVYGGGATGLMGTLADAALAAGGRVVGILPKGLFRREAGHAGLSQLHEVGSMHERKQLMYELSDAFVALPGGLGTLEELTEIATWAQLGIHDRPVAVLDVGGYWRPLAALLDRAVELGYLPARSRGLVLWVDRVGDLLPALEAYEPPPAEAGLGPSET